MLDISRSLADMANQIRAGRSADGLTLQQLATRSGVAASTIHKVEARQMVPTVSVLLKIAKGLGRRPEELIRDRVADGTPSHESECESAESAKTSAEGDPGRDEVSPRIARPDVGVWQLDLPGGRTLPSLDLDPLQRAIVVVEKGEVELKAGDQRFQMDTGDCIEVKGGTIHSSNSQPESATLMLIVSPPGNLDTRLGSPRTSAPPQQAGD
jgi:transcriptional regulator with XRE-family HTH domain